MLDKNKFVIKQQTKMLSTKNAYDIIDGDSNEVLGTAVQKAGMMAMIVGMVLGKENMSFSLEVRKKSDNALAFTVRRHGFLFKKVEVLDAEGKPIGAYKAKKFSLSGGYHVYDQEGKHIADIKGKMLSAEFKIMTPDGATEMGSVSRSWGGMAKALLTGAGTYGLQIAPEYANNIPAKTVMLGAVLAVDAMFKPAKSKAGGGEEGGGDGGGE